MINICLIHGSAHGPKGWKNLQSELTKYGHESIALELPLGKGDEPIETFLDYLEKDIKAKQVDVNNSVIVAHSSGCMFLPLLVNRLIQKGQRPLGMIFLAGFVPRAGKSLMEEALIDKTMMNPDWIGKNPMEDHVAIEFQFHDCKKKDIEEALSQRVFFFAKKAMENNYPIFTYPNIPTGYITCTKDRTFTEQWQDKVAEERLNIKAKRIESGHCPQNCKPQMLAKVLNEYLVEMT
ncbi:MAG: alpha/beta hydrolase [Bacteroidota bacterium]